MAMIMRKILKLLSMFMLIGAGGCASTGGMNYAALNVTAVDADHPPAIAELNFKSGGQRLNGLMYQANGSGPHPTVILLHGYPGNEKNLDLAQALRRGGFNVLFFHYRGAWGSEGEFSFNNVIEDVGSALGFLRSNAEGYKVDTDHITLIGHSMGGFAALQGAARDKNVHCVAGISAANLGGRAANFAKGSEAAKGFSNYSDGLQMLAGWSGDKAISEIIANGESFNLNALAPRLSGKSVLLIAGDKDGAVPAQTVHRPMAAAYKMQDGLNLTEMVLSGDHSFSWSRGTLIQTVLDWAQTCR